MNFSPKVKSWIILICMLLGTYLVISTHTQTMKSLLTVLLLALTAVLTGCSTATSGTPAMPLVQPFLDRLVPADFVGDGKFSERGQYLTLEIKAGGLQKLPSGAWSWKTLEYRRILTIPLAPGVPYRQEGWIKLGPPLAK